MKKQKMCLWCGERPVTGLYGPRFNKSGPWYDESSNSCENCLNEALVKIGKSQLHETPNKA